MEPTYFINNQPKRDWQGMGFRTHHPTKTYPYNVLSPMSMAAQVMLYRWSTDVNLFVNMVKQSELHEYLMHPYPFVGKKTLGTVICSSTIYNPRVLKGGSATTKPAQCYLWRRRLDLVYGLEWQLCTWLWEFGGDMQDHLKDISSRPLGEVHAKYLQKMPTYRQMDWPEIFEKYDLPEIGTIDKWFPDWGIPVTKADRPPPPVSRATAKMLEAMEK